MMYSIYETATGRVVCVNECRDGLAPPEGPLADDESLSVIHEALCLHIGMVVDGCASRLPDDEIQAQEDRDQWFAFRQARSKHLSRTDHLVQPDYPLSQAERRAIKAKRKASRDIPQKTTNPRLAMQMLETIWSDE